MKKQLSARGYARTILLSLMAACVIEAVVNADEVKAAFTAGKNLKKATRTAIRSSPTASGWLKVPQHISKGIGWIYHTVFE